MGAFPENSYSPHITNLQFLTTNEQDYTGTPNTHDETNIYESRYERTPTILIIFAFEHARSIHNTTHTRTYTYAMSSNSTPNTSPNTSPELSQGPFPRPAHKPERKTSEGGTELKMYGRHSDQWLLKGWDKLFHRGSHDGRKSLDGKE